MKRLALERWRWVGAIVLILVAVMAAPPPAAADNPDSYRFWRTVTATYAIPANGVEFVATANCGNDLLVHGGYELLGRNTFRDNVYLTQLTEAFPTPSRYTVVVYNWDSVPEYVQVSAQCASPALLRYKGITDLYYTSEVTRIPAHSTAYPAAVCGSGYLLVSGGYISNLNVSVRNSFPFAAAWALQATNFSAFDQEVKVQVICAKVSGASYFLISDQAPPGEWRHTFAVCPPGQNMLHAGYLRETEALTLTGTVDLSGPSSGNELSSVWMVDTFNSDPVPRTVDIIYTCI